MGSPALVVTVAAVVERDGRFLMVQERPHGALVWNQPAGRVEPKERLVDAVVRETHEETGWHVHVDHLIGVYQWTNESLGRSYIRFAFACTADHRDPDPKLDDPVVLADWRSLDELRSGQFPLRSPLILPAFEDYRGGEAVDIEVFKSLD